MKKPIHKPINLRNTTALVLAALACFTQGAYASGIPIAPKWWWNSSSGNSGPGPEGSTVDPGGNCESCLQLSGLHWTGILTPISSNTTSFPFSRFKGCQFTRADGKTQDNGCVVIARFVCPTGYALNDAGGAHSPYCTPSGLIDLKNRGKPKYCPTGNPINQGTGNKYQQETDFAGVSPAALQLVRTYNSQPNDISFPITGMFGSNWTTQFDRSIKLFIGPATLGNNFVINTDQLNTAMVQRPDGKAYFFTLTGNAWIADSDISDKLVQLNDASNRFIGWQYTNADDEIETYDATGKLLRLQSRAGLTQTLSYSEAGSYVLDANGNATTTPLPGGLLTRVTDAYGRTLRFGYNANNRVVSLLDPAGGVTRYSYDAAQNLSAVTFPDGKRRAYLYNESANTSGANLPYALTGIMDENGVRYVTFFYDSTGKANEEIYPAAGSNTNHYKISYAPLSSDITDPLGSVRTFKFSNILGVRQLTGQDQPGGSGCSASSNTVSYDDNNGNIASRTDFNGNKTSYQYDPVSNVETNRVEAVGTPLARSMATTWHTVFRLPTQTLERDGTGKALRQTDIVYDSHGNKTSESIKDITSSATRTSTWSYIYSTSVAGHVEQIINNGPRSDIADVTTLTFWPADAACPGTGIGYDKGCRGQLKQINNALGQITQYSRYSPNGQLEQIVAPDGVMTSLSYDTRQRQTSVSRSAGNSTETQLYQYDGLGQRVQTTLENGSVLRYTYDAAHRLTQITDNLGNRVNYTLDAMGNHIAEDTYDPTGTPARSLGFSFDALNRLQLITGQ